jgi:hypothetical protein
MMTPAKKYEMRTGSSDRKRSVRRNICRQLLATDTQSIVVDLKIRNDQVNRTPTVPEASIICKDPSNQVAAGLLMFSTLATESGPELFASLN